MRVLFVCLPGVGHIRPMLPLARAMRAAGHDIRFATGRDFRPHVTAAGFSYEAVGPTRAEAKAERLRRHPESVGLDPTEQQRFHVRKVWAGIYAPATLPDLLTVLARWPADLVVHDAMSFAAPLAAARLRVPAVSHSTGPGFAGTLLDEAAEAVAPLWRVHGLDPPRAAGIYDTLHVDVWPESLQPEDLGDRGAVLSISTDDDEPGPGEAMPDWFAQLPQQPNVHVTLGTVFNEIAVIRTVVQTLRDQPINLLVTVGPDRSPDELGVQPPNVRVESWLPHRQFLSTCAVVICHGGAGTTLKSLRLGIPMLLLPQGADMFRTARTCEMRGVALSLGPGTADAEHIRAAFGQLSTDHRYRPRCELIGKEIAQLTSPEDVASVLTRNVPRWSARA